MSNETSKLSLKLLFTDFFLLIVSFFAVHYLKNGTLALAPLYKQLLILLCFNWLFISLLSKKFHPESYNGYWKSIFEFVRSDLFLLFFISFWIVIIGLSSYSRLQIFGTCGLLFFAESIIFTIYYLFVKKQKVEIDFALDKKQNRSYFLFISDFILLTLAFFVVHYFKRNTFALDNEYEKLFYIIIGLWIVTMILTRKFDRRHFESFFHAIAPCVKSVIFMAFIMATLIFGLQMFAYSRLQIFGFLLVFFILEIMLWLVYYYYRKETVADVESPQEVRSIMKQEYLSADIDHDARLNVLYQPIQTKMKEDYFKNSQKVFDFFNKAVNLSDIIRVETMILDTSESLNFNLISLAHTRLMINLHRLNDIRWVNRYFLQAHGILADNGYLAGKAETIDVLGERFEKKYPKYFRAVLYLLYFIWARLLPKLTTTKKLYFNITKGKNRAISRTEILGRLSFCGFKIIAEEYIDGEFYFIGQKVKTPSLDENPSYGPFVRFERVGYNGKLVYMYKFRTMYPYSEYLQEYVHQLNQLREGGKFKDDFRVTGYGKIMRKLWIDELPMLYNWFKGDLQLVGVRPLSKHYLNLYTPELQELRKKVKPGLVPPFYADMPKTLEEIMASEERYIKAYKEKPFSTQWRYFWKCFYNIFFKKARSA